MTTLLASIFSPRQDVSKSSPAQKGSPTDRGAKTPSRKSRARIDKGLTPRPMALETIMGENDVGDSDGPGSKRPDDTTKIPQRDAAQEPETASTGREATSASTAVERGEPDVVAPNHHDEDGARDEVEAEQSEKEFTFKRFRGHRWVGDAMEINVEWHDGERTWEPETHLHHDARTALLTYWRQQGGRPTNPRDADVYDVYAIKRHSKDRKRLLVEWVGFGPKDATWEPRSEIEKTAGGMVATYFKNLPKRR